MLPSPPRPTSRPAPAQVRPMLPRRRRLACSMDASCGIRFNESSYDSANTPTTANRRWQRCRHLPGKRSGGSLAERRDNMVDHFLDQDAVVTLAHHANDGLGARGTDQETAMTV